MPYGVSTPTPQYSWLRAFPHSSIVTAFRHSSGRYSAEFRHFSISAFQHSIAAFQYSSASIGALCQHSGILPAGIRRNFSISAFQHSISAFQYSSIGAFQHSSIPAVQRHLSIPAFQHSSIPAFQRVSDPASRRNELKEIYVNILNLGLSSADNIQQNHGKF